MTSEQEREMHKLAELLYETTKGTGWEAMRYMAIGQLMERLSLYMPACEGCAERNRLLKGEK